MTTILTQGVLHHEYLEWHAEGASSTRTPKRGQAAKPGLDCESRTSVGVHRLGQLRRSVIDSVTPARSRHLRDKAAVEVGVQIVQRWILPRIRNEVFHPPANPTSEFCWWNSTAAWCGAMAVTAPAC